MILGEDNCGDERKVKGQKDCFEGNRTVINEAHQVQSMIEDAIEESCMPSYVNIFKVLFGELINLDDEMTGGDVA